MLPMSPSGKQTFGIGRVESRLSRLNRRRPAWLIALLCLALGALQPGFAQEPDANAEDAQERIEADRAADLRDAINENLTQPLPESETGEAVPATAPPEVVPSVSDTDTAEGETEAPWYERFETTADRLQTLPERIPPLAGKGWLHFGRVEFEYGHFTEGVLEDDSGFNFRSLRGGLIREVNDRLILKFELDLTDGDSNFTDLWARYRTRIGVFTLGNQKIAQTLVNQTSRLSRTFMEEPLPADAFGLGRRLGVGWDFHWRRVGAHLTAFGPDLNDNIGKFGYGARLYTNPTRTRFSVFHLGVSAVQEQMDRDAQFRAYPESRVTDLRLVDTDRVDDVDTQSILGLEAAGSRESFSMRSEVFLARWDRDLRGTSNFDGFYVQANWALTGEHYQYTEGKFLRLRPEGDRGAWELALRYSTVDLSDDDIRGGEQSNLTAALNWYGPGRQLRVQSSLAYIGTDEIAGNQNLLLAQVRVQVHW